MALDSIPGGEKGKSLVASSCICPGRFISAAIFLVTYLPPVSSSFFFLSLYIALTVLVLTEICLPNTGIEVCRHHRRCLLFLDLFPNSLPLCSSPDELVSPR